MKQETRIDFYLIAFVCGYFFIHALNLYVKLVLQNFTYWNYLSKIPLFVLLLLSLLGIYKRNLKTFIISEISACILFLFTFLRGNASFSEYKSVFLNLIAVYIPLGVSVACIKNKYLFFKCLYILSWPIHALLIYTLIIKGTGAWTYSMPLGYALAFQTLIVWEHFFRKKRIFDLILVIADIVMILVFASRGPIVCLLVFLLVELVFSRRIKTPKKIIHLICLFSIAAFVLINANNFLDILSGFSSRFAHYSRTIVKLVSGDFFSDSGRSELTQHYFEIIKDNWAFGCGISGGWDTISDYPHNLFVEFWLSYGVILGTVIGLVILFLVVKCLLSKTYEMQSLFFIFISYCFCLLMSDSYVMCPHFFIFFFVGVDYVYKLKKHKDHSLILGTSFNLGSI